ncbi:3-deoxy-7-phosphoheptulonate synthase, partial [Actinomadura sp. NPDC048032]|uniref:3-deoxy-7-phosphoheptulonate synthase n=1 Tax=Actinomadura sp. NPDC048032 TaxID=3155747 RepID=UPI0033D1DE97
MSNSAVIGDLDAWRALPALQQPDWDDPAEVGEVAAELAAQPPLVFAGECDQLKAQRGHGLDGHGFAEPLGDPVQERR